MSLKEDLGAFAQQLSQNVPQEVLQTMGDEIGKMINSGITEQALQKGQKGINFTLNDSDGNATSLDTLLQKGPVILSFNRGNWCPFCNIEFKALQNSLPEINSANASLVVISPQLPEKSKTLKAENGFDFPILYDKNNEVADKYGLKFTLSAPLRPIHLAFDMDIPAHNGNDSYELSVPATYVIGTDGTILYSYINPNWMERGEPSDFLQTLN